MNEPSTWRDIAGAVVMVEDFGVVVVMVGGRGGGGSEDNMHKMPLKKGSLCGI